MPTGEPRLPAGYTYARFDEIDSTNAEALRRAGNPGASGLWIWAARQTAGMGRSGRMWQSQEGNLFASLLLEPSCPLAVCPRLAFVAGLAAFDAVNALADDALSGRLRLKWPNDLLLDGAKLGGILLESVPPAPPDNPSVVLGTGLNLASHPPDQSPPAISLASQGIPGQPMQAFEQLAFHSAKWIDIWSEGEGWSEIRLAWEERSLPPGTAMRVNLARETVQGTYGGIGDDGRLWLDTGEAIREIHAGDVFLL